MWTGKFASVLLVSFFRASRADPRRPHLGQRWRAPRASPLVLGHRGDSANHPENTLAALKGAMNAGADGVELDVRLCGSSELLVFHDEDLQRLCGDPRRIDDLSLQEIADVRVGGEPIPTLLEVLNALPLAVVNIELKRHPMSQALALVTACAQAVTESRSLGRVIISSFDPRLLLMLRVLEPNLPRALLFAEEQGLPLRRGWLATTLSACAVHPEHVLVSGTRMSRWRRRGYRVHTWTVDDPVRIAELARIGVHAIICNDPGAAIASLA
ncbi:MAG: glycerophosphodiester phosphodiesterase [Myxococcales bacterium]|nr:glycerophosphodiester phosphodiesterase [Myxococcales bacterium]